MDVVPARDAAVLQGRVLPPGPSGTRGGAAGRRRVAVVGAGAVGGYFAARAAEAGAEVLLCVRGGGFDRLRIVRAGPAAGGGVTELRLPVVRDPADLGGPVDWIVLATKAHQTPAAMGWLRAGLGAGTGVVVAQNGVDHAERVSPPVPRDAVLPAVVYLNAELERPGVVRHLAYGVLQVPDGPLGERFAGVLPPGDVRLVPDFATAAWSKLLSNSAANSLTALTARGLEVLARPDVGELALAVMRETASVARAAGARIAADAPERTLARLGHQPPGAGTSMLRDRLAGRPLEHDALLGAVVRTGGRLGVPTPTCAVLLPVLAALSASPAVGPGGTP
ncbi:2-dehydropantoate 2-reductase [Parafrankia sp. FMc6]|uniref:2-dehydropantoate 2-reductase n=1 Tax=Parafrankia soli TaxID=2599596 RepID=UPI0034D4AC85